MQAAYYFADALITLITLRRYADARHSLSDGRGQHAPCHFMMVRAP